MKHINNNPRRASLRLWLLLGVFCSAIMAAQAGTLYFQGSGSGSGRDWNVAANFSENSTGGAPTRVPTNAAPFDDLVFGSSITPQYTALATRPRVGNFNVKSLNLLNSGWLVSVAAATDKITLGSGGLIYNLGNLPGQISTGFAPAQTQFRCLIDLSASCTIFNGDLTNSLSIRQDATDFTAGNFGCLNLGAFTLTFDGPGTNSFATITAGNHAGGSVFGSGGIIKNGAGATTFGATNTYSGPTVINQGLFGVRSMCSGGGSYTVADGATLQVTMNSPGQSLKMSSLNVTSTTTNSLNLAMTSTTSVGNPTAPMIFATNLTLNGNIYLTLNGSGLSEGTIPLIQYNGSIAGSGTMLINSLPTGVGATLTNNTAAKQWQLVVTSVPALVWIGKTNTALVGQWDLSGTTNWLNTDTGLQAAYANGLPVMFNDTGLTNVVTLVTNVTPFSLTVSNNALTYTLNESGGGFQANPSGGLIKDGTGLFILSTTNTYTSFTSIKQGMLRTTVANAIGRAIGQSGANLTNNGILDLNGFNQNVGALWGAGVITNSAPTPVRLYAHSGVTEGGNFTGQIDEGTGGAITLYKPTGVLTMSGNNNYSGGTRFSANGAAANRHIKLGGNNVLGTGPVVFEINAILSADASPRGLTNSISIQNVNAGMTIGNTGSGLLTLSGPIDVNAAGGDQAIIFPSDVILSGPFTSTSGGVSTKDGAGTLTLLNNTVTWLNTAADARITDGSMVIDNAAVTVAGGFLPNFRVQSIVTNGSASLFITNNGSLTVGSIFGYGRLRIGDTGSAPGTTNIVDIRGVLTAEAVTMGYTSTNTGSGALARLDLQPGSQVTLGQFTTTTNTKAVTEINLDGTTINATEDAASSFLQGMTNVFVKGGGVTLNAANTNSIHIRQHLLSGGGSGGLTKAGAGTLQLDGVNTYTGTTLISSGALGGIGSIAGPVVIADGSLLIPGGGGNIGTLTVNNLTLNAGAQVTFELNNTNDLSSATNDYLVVTGTLSITGSSLTVQNDGTNLVAGNSFKLFSVPVTSGFTNVILPTLDSGLAWNNKLAVDGSIQVVVAVVNPPSLGVSQLGNLLTFSWAESGFKLQSQTNTINVGITGSWGDYPGGTVSGVTATIDPANPTVFFRLVSQ